MANVSRINGFNPVGTIGSASWNGRVGMYSIDATDATAIGVGDLVKLDSSSDATTGVPQVTRAVVTSICVGAVVGFKVDPTDLNNPQQYRKALTQRFVFVADDPKTVFEVQANAAMTVGIVGANCEVTIAACSTITGMSAMQADMSVTGTTATLTLKILGFSPRVDNAVAATYNKILVKINSHYYADGTGGTGI